MNFADIGTHITATFTKEEATSLKTILHSFYSDALDSTSRDSMNALNWYFALENLSGDKEGSQQLYLKLCKLTEPQWKAFKFHLEGDYPAHLHPSGILNRSEQVLDFIRNVQIDILMKHLQRTAPHYFTDSGSFK